MWFSGVNVCDTIQFEWRIDWSAFKTFHEKVNRGQVGQTRGFLPTVLTLSEGILSKPVVINTQLIQIRATHFTFLAPQKVCSSTLQSKNFSLSNRNIED